MIEPRRNVGVEGRYSGRAEQGRNQLELPMAGVGWGCEKREVENVPDFHIKEAGSCLQRRQRSGGGAEGGENRWYNFLEKMKRILCFYHHTKAAFPIFR